MVKKKKDEKKSLESNDSEIKSLKDDIDTYKSLAQRAQADLVNFRKRVEAEQLEIRERVKNQLVLKLLEVVDQLDVALDNKTLDESWITGIDAIHKNLINILSSEGYKKFNSKGEIFDPRKHDALLSTISKEEANIILNEIRPGYIRGENVVRPAQVEISKLEDKKNI
ncbi:MAG: nucleotide exchange factor GrpE [Dehalococcoidia bacterium]|nr:nucleotide exchange factor GrpE [Dehalococcoidia bacterium]MQG08956.1 nucleotide exchange factor GrpE [SAR202 cluster bacterium]|tara:strand:- start:3087 stop:3590 length:504 start_codon:yes stop_codon:yes gene_type:complete